MQMDHSVSNSRRQESRTWFFAWMPSFHIFEGRYHIPPQMSFLRAKAIRPVSSPVIFVRPSQNRLHVIWFLHQTWWPELDTVFEVEGRKPYNFPPRFESYILVDTASNRVCSATSHNFDSSPAINYCSKIFFRCNIIKPNILPFHAHTFDFPFLNELQICLLDFIWLLSAHSSNLPRLLWILFLSSSV